MGVSLAWVGVQATSAHDIHAILGLTEAGPSGHFLDFALSGFALASGWHLIVAKPCDHAIRSDRVLAALSSQTSVVACSVEEHVMFMSAESWRGSEQVWDVKHRGGDFGDSDLVVIGAPPDPFEDLRFRCLSAQESAIRSGLSVDHVADIPLELARSIVGFRHDVTNPGIDERTFQALRADPAGLLAQAARPWWKFW